MLFSFGINEICSKVVGTGGEDVNWNEPDAEIQIFHVLHYIWKVKWKKKENQRKGVGIRKKGRKERKKASRPNYINFPVNTIFWQTLL